MIVVNILLEMYKQKTINRKFFKILNKYLQQQPIHNPSYNKTEKKYLHNIKTLS